MEGSCQRFKEFLIRLANTVVDFVARSPEGIYIMIRITVERIKASLLTASSRWKFSKAKRCVVGWSRLKSDIAVPAGSLLLLGAELSWASLLVELVELN